MSDGATNENPANEESGEPAWHLLPADPIGFFGLQPDFDRKDLKRAYNTLLRRYKPDKFPQEFQRLRAAYEQLDGELRYGQSHEPPTSRLDNFQWNPSSSSNSDNLAPKSDNSAPERDREPDREQDAYEQSDAEHESGEGPQPIFPRFPSSPQPVPVPKTLAERVETESLVSLYEELKQNPREPYDYYALAVLSDSVADRDRLAFLDWLLKGVKVYPDHPALTQLLMAYFQDGDVPDERLTEVLLRVSQVINKDRFYYLTEKLFDRLTLAADWNEVQTTLQRCSANINDPNIRSRVVFTCHLLRRALWLAPIERCEEMMAYVNHHFEYLQGSLEYEQELNSMLLSFVQVRERFIVKGPIAQMMDQALRKYCLASDGRGDYEIVKVQAYIAQHAEQLFREFKLTPDEDMQLLVPWIWISDEVEDRLETQEAPPKPERLMSATFQMLQQVDQNFPLTPIQFYNFIDRAVPLGICMFLIIGLPSIVGASIATRWPTVWDIVFPILFFGGMALAALYWFWGQRRTTSVWLVQYLRRMIQKHYLRWWRSLIARFFAATHFTYRDVDRAIDGVLELRRTELNISNWMPHFYSRDPALYVYATAVRFLR